MMRKLFILCLALAMVAIAVPAMAQSNVNFSGWVDVWHENQYNFQRNNADTGWRDSDSWFSYRVTLNVEFQPSEDVSVFWRIRSLPFIRWGTVRAGSGGAPDRGADLWTSYLYAEVRQPWGTIQIGRVKGGLASNAGGLASLGYTPGWGLYGALYAQPFDLNNPDDAIIYSYDFGNGFSLAAYYAKDDTGTNYPTGAMVAGLIAANGTPDFPDQDNDRFGIEAKYVWDTGGFTFGLAYVRDMTGYREYTVAADAFGTTHPYLPANNWLIHLNPALVQSWGPFSVHFEGDIAFGRTKWADACNGYVDYFGLANDCVPGADQDSIELGLGLYLDLNYNYGAGDITLMSWYNQGTPWDIGASTAVRNAVNMGDFAPFLVAYYGSWAAGNGFYENTIASLNGGVFGLGLLGNHAVNDDIRLNWGIGYFRLTAEQAKNQDRYLGLEIDLGANFRILDNLSFETQFGYMWNGPAWRFTPGLDANGNSTLNASRPDGTFAWANFLTVTF